MRTPRPAPAGLADPPAALRLIPLHPGPAQPQEPPSQETGVNAGQWARRMEVSSLARPTLQCELPGARAGSAGLVLGEGSGLAQAGGPWASPLGRVREW